ncbi:MAG: glycosyltransferase [Pseudomonadota bacterium]|nr:MAG: glycosyltransferase [Pseudomonadota bacterium]
MNIVVFCHSLLSDWNHGNAHFLRGLVTELALRGHRVRAYEPEDAWSVENLVAEAGEAALRSALERYPMLDVTRYRLEALDVEAATDGADLVIVHEWNDPRLVRQLGRLRARAATSFKLLFHDTHHRSVTEGRWQAELDLSGYDGVLAFGEALRERYLSAGWSERVYTFHEAADVRVFRPMPDVAPERDLVWIGNWGDEERTQELSEFVFRPARVLGLTGSVHGVRYPDAGLAAVRDAGLSFEGWLPNYEVPRVFARHRVTVHVPRRPYAERLPGIPTIRVFEALACGIALVSAPWDDSESLFRADDFWMVRDGSGMQRALRWLLSDAEARAELARRGRETVLARHTCGHRADQLLGIAEELGVARSRLGDPIRRAVPEAALWD